ncbi:hypothetical protein H072_4235 [Dactylellina haptotyla CBS 200.50]|uniref:PA14 domain-containing protein n=1 Tax=Dactylellina haptotyla (strain CBS 200.50) TaxID=1284197 RepID=S8AG65_DACHA|nr:hypothetical protein H072_4235 [Dactylellina haptotyla CBS 200.50]
MVITFLTQPATTVFMVGTSTFTTTVTPNFTNIMGTISVIDTITDGTDTITIIVGVPRLFTTVTTLASSAYTSTIYPTNVAGSILTDPTIPATIVISSPQHITTVTTLASSIYTTTHFPTNSIGSTITDGTGTITVVVAFPTHSNSATITDSSGTITIITYITEAGPITTTVTQVDSNTRTMIVFPTDSNGAPITTGAITISKIIYITQAITTITTTGPQASTTTKLPMDSNSSTITDGSGMVTIIITVVPKQPVTVITQGPVASITTKYPTNSNGSTITDGSEPYTVVVTQGIVTVTTPGPNAGTTTKLPTNAAGSTLTDGSVTVTTVGPIVGTTTKYPTNSAGVTLGDGSGTVSVIVTKLPGPMTTVIITGPAAGTETQFPTNSAGSMVTNRSEGTAMVRIMQPVVTITSIGLTAGTTTQFPIDGSGSTLSDRARTSNYITTIFFINNTGVIITDGSNTITIIDFISQFITTVTQVGSSTSIIIVYFTDGSGSTIINNSGTIFVITFVTQRRTTVTQWATGTAPSTTTIFPDPTNISGTISIIDFATPEPTADLSCSNGGMQVAIYETPFLNAAGGSAVGWVYEYFGGIQPYDNKTTNSLGFGTAGVLDPNPPYGFATRASFQDGAVFALNFRGYFYANTTQTYTIKVANADDRLGVWTGEKAYTKWSTSNADILGFFVEVSFEVSLNAGDYMPLRVIYGNGGGYATYDLDITGADDIVYVQTHTPSDFLISQSCDGIADPFPPFGKEFPIPASTSSLPEGLSTQISPFALNYNENSWTRKNADAYNYGTITFSLQLTEQSYTPIRILYGDTTGAGKFVFKIKDANGFIYLEQENLPSVYVVQDSCDNFMQLDVTCNNISSMVVLWYNPFENNGAKVVVLDDYNTTYFGTIPPLKTRDITIVDNVDVKVKDLYITGLAKVNWIQTLTAGTYLPFRLQWANGQGGGEFSFKVVGMDSYKLVRALQTSPYFVSSVCDLNIQDFDRPFGEDVDEVDLQPSCEPGSGAAWYENPWLNTATEVLPGYDVTYFASRIPVEQIPLNTISCAFSIKGADGIFYANPLETSEYLSGRFWDPNIQPFSKTFGNELPYTDQTCNNASMEVAIYDVPEDHLGAGVFSLDGSYVKSITPYRTNTTIMPEVPGNIGINPYFFVPRQADSTFSMMHRGFVYIPASRTYYIDLSILNNDNSTAQLWIGNFATSGWHFSNANILLSSGALQDQTIPIALTGPAYVPLRIAWTHSGSGVLGFALLISDQYGFTLSTSSFRKTPYLVQRPCDGTGNYNAFPPWGQET